MFMHGLAHAHTSPCSPDQAWNVEFRLVTGGFGVLSCVVGTCGLETAFFPTQVYNLKIQPGKCAPGPDGSSLGFGDRSSPNQGRAEAPKGIQT